jgi:AraC-like DNA-binding protein
VAAPTGQRVTAWRPDVPGIAEVFHAHITDHAYPMHTHDTWTLVIVDHGTIRYDLERSHHGVRLPEVALLPPHVPHDGRPASDDGFHKRVLYLDEDTIGTDLIGAAVDAPHLCDPRVRRWVHRLHLALRTPGEEFAAQSRLALVRDELVAHLRRDPAPLPIAPPLARQLRELLDAAVIDGVTLAEAAAQLHAHPGYLVRCFTGTFGISPHAYLTGRRIDRARRLLLCGVPPAQVAAAAGFYDQAHLTRHFRRHLGITPGRYAAAG